MWGAQTVLADRYRLVQRIGSGSMGDVWRAEDTVLGREVAVKILLPALLHDTTFAERFRTEARILAALNHPGIVSIHDYGHTDDPRAAFLVMELIAGRPLTDLLDDEAPLPEPTTLTILAQTLEALQAAHDQGIVHRDVKPANLMLRDGAVVVTDFGVARAAGGRRLTAADVVLGTAVYAAPEQSRGSEVTAAADLYAVGIIAYECLTAAPPFDGDTPLGIMMQHEREPVPPLPETVSPPVRELVERALAKDPADRFSSAREVAALCRKLLARHTASSDEDEDEDVRDPGVGRVGIRGFAVFIALVAAAATAGVVLASGRHSSIAVSPTHRDLAITNAVDSGFLSVSSPPADGTPVMVLPSAGVIWRATPFAAGGHTDYEFGYVSGSGSGLNLAADTLDRVVIRHDAASANRLWWVTSDVTAPRGTYYLHSEQFGTCLTAAGPEEGVSLKPCAAGDKAQQWYLP